MKIIEKGTYIVLEIEGTDETFKTSGSVVTRLGLDCIKITHSVGTYTMDLLENEIYVPMNKVKGIIII